VTRTGILAAAFGLAIAVAPGIAAADRLADEQVKSQFQQVDKNVDRWIR
jgi:hypothetical protein